MQSNRWIDRLCKEQTLPLEGFRSLLECRDREEIEYLYSSAREVSQRIFGREIYVRALIEVTNRCRNNCLYCGIRAANSEVERYTLNHESILRCCQAGHDIGFRTFVLQGGESPTMSGEWMVDLVGKIRRRHPDSAITLSLGELPYELYEALYEAGADRYLLRHESHNAEHYSTLHPPTMRIESRIQALDNLKAIGYQTGTGIMVGAPEQSIDNIIEDIKYIELFRPEMIGIGPFIPHHATPFANYAAGSIELTLKLIAIFRLMHPQALIPATTALATLAEDGRIRGILAGANVVMPNISPSDIRANYALYDNKAAFGSESGEGVKLLSEELKRIGYSINFGRGDYK